MNRPAQFRNLVVVAIIAIGFSGCGKSLANSGTPELKVSPAALHFSAAPSQTSDPPPAPIAIANAGSGSLTFSASTDASWLAVTPNGGSAPESVEVSAMIGALAPGTYTGHVIVKSDGVEGSPASVEVTFTIAKSEPQKRG
ncbi:MAG TPA: hypothetical protein VMJ93_04080 [Verrucomicrobiae bacterium]|nr:hypothetical protein [Verrucomicrobiae bacterium]